LLRFPFVLISKEQLIAVPPNAITHSYTYSASNQRLKTVDGSSTNTWYVWEGGKVMAEYNTVSSVHINWQKSYVYLGERLLATESTSVALQFHHPDRLGTRLVTNASDGSSAGEQETLPFGTALGAGISGNQRRFTSYDRSTTTKLDYAVNRTYNAGLGRFTQVDPIGMTAASLSDPQTLNLYAYCGNDPINHVDPDGLFFKKLFGWIGKALKFIFKVAAVIVAVIAVMALGAIGQYWGSILITKGLVAALFASAAILGIAGWHNGKLGNAVRTVLLAGGGNNNYGGFRTPPINGANAVGGVSLFIQTQASGNALSTTTYRTAQAAAIAVLMLINRRSRRENAEYSGAICLSINGRYSYTLPARFPPLSQQTGPNTNDPRNSSPAPSCPTGTSMVADYHTHAAYDRSIDTSGTPGGDNGNELFSPGDIQGNEGQNTAGVPMPGYLATPNRRIRRYNPVGLGGPLGGTTTTFRVRTP
jgi:RHS repeat-associated protein